MSYAGIALRWLLIAVVLLIAAIGFLYITRGTAVTHVRGVGADGAPVSPEEPQFPLSVAVLTGTMLSSGNRVEIALDGDGTFPRLWEDLCSAQHAITVQMYYGMPGHVADSLRRILEERAKAGVRVFVLYDAFGNQDPSPLNDQAVQSVSEYVLKLQQGKPTK
jgi:cardiolipin synthase